MQHVHILCNLIIPQTIMTQLLQTQPFKTVYCCPLRQIKHLGMFPLFSRVVAWSSELPVDCLFSQLFSEWEIVLDVFDDAFE